jgi:hypothetical protein
MAHKCGDKATSPLCCIAAAPACDDGSASSWASRICAEMDWRAARTEPDSAEQIAYENAAHEASRLYYACASVQE